MKILVLLCAAIMLAGCSEEKSTGDPKIDQALKDAVHFDSLATGDWTGRFYQNNEPYSGWAIRTDRWGVAALLQFKDGKMNGLSTQWHENGQKRGETTFKDGKIDGLAKGWHENGQKEAEVTWKDGEKDGPWTMWHENGQKQSEATWKDGVTHGPYNTWYSNGQKRKEGFKKDGKRQGLVTEFHSNGQKWSEVTYKDDEQVSAKYWNSKGEEVESLDEAEE